MYKIVRESAYDEVMWYELGQFHREYIAFDLYEIVLEFGQDDIFDEALLLKDEVTHVQLNEVITHKNANMPDLRWWIQYTHSSGSKDDLIG